MIQSDKINQKSIFLFDAAKISCNQTTKSVPFLHFQNFTFDLSGALGPFLSPLKFHNKKLFINACFQAKLIKAVTVQR